MVERFRVSKLLAFRGLSRTGVDRAAAGDIVALAGMSRATVADTLCDPSVEDAIAARPIDPPTISVTISINDSPLAGRSGDKVQSRVIRERLLREAEGNVAIRVADTEDRDALEVSGRGELQMGVLIETMRREGFELSVSRPRVLFRDIDGVSHEPLEEVTVDVDDDYAGVVIDKLAQRRGELVEMRPSGGGKTRIVAHVPSRGLIGYHGEFLTDTRGTGVLNRMFHSWTPHRGPVPGRRNGALVSIGRGAAVAYALWNLEERGRLFIGPGESVYEGMVIGESSRSGDLEVNPLKGKKLTNIRAAGKDDAVILTTPARMSLEVAIAYVDDDELVEVTPDEIRIRKRWLDPHERKRRSRNAT
jgi:GTP-binding protein